MHSHGNTYQISHPSAEPGFLTRAGAKSLQSYAVWICLIPAIFAWGILYQTHAGLTEFPLCITIPENILSKLDANFRLHMLQFEPKHLLIDWVVMIIAMMFPTLILPIEHLKTRMFSRQRLMSISLFLISYMLVWLGVGIIATLFLLLPHILLATVELSSYGAFIGCSLAALWQLSRTKQKALGYCHHLPPMAVYGFKAYTSPLSFGCHHGIRCALNCAPLMILPMIAGHSLTHMIVVSLIIFFERSVEKPNLKPTAILIFFTGLTSIWT